MLSDPEMAQMIVEQEDDNDVEYAPPLAEWDTHAVIMSRIHDRLGEVISAVLGTIQTEKGKSPPKYSGKNFPTPRTAVDEMREAMARQAGLQLIKWFTPHAN